eukprot:scaffold45346_cov61-Phaeocystis_antarctica.AAC.3
MQPRPRTATTLCTRSTAMASCPHWWRCQASATTLSTVPVVSSKALLTMDSLLPHSTPPSLPGTFSRQHSSTTARQAASPSTRASGASCSLRQFRKGPSAQRAVSLRRLPARRSSVLTSGRMPGESGMSSADRKREFECGD